MQSPGYGPISPTVARQREARNGIQKEAWPPKLFWKSAGSAFGLPETKPTAHCKRFAPKLAN